jgi:hypothetical protein
LAEVLGEAVAEPFEQRHAEFAADRVSDRVADDGAYGRGGADGHRVDVERVSRGEQCRTDECDLARQWNPETLDADDGADDEIHRQWWNRLQHRVHIHAAKTAIRRANPQVLSAKNLSAAELTAWGASMNPRCPVSGISR